MSKNLLVYLNTLRLKGYLAYEYNPFYNYLTDVDLYEVDTDVGKVKVPKGLAVNLKNGLLLTKKGDKWVDNFSRVIDNNVIIPTEDDLIVKAGSLVDLDTEQLNFDLEHPVDITVQPSYDGSVNLILNDDKNIPRLINSRFSAREKGTYEIVDRIGENDTNIYNSKTFDKDTSLYFQYEYNPEVLYLGFINGVLPVGLYCFYFTYCDSDDNESDYIAETGVIPVFIGSDCDPNSIDGGIKNQLSNKGIRLKLTNIDKSYNYFKVYYVRYFADYQLNRVYECKKIYKRFPINSSTITVLITGNEETEDLDANILNISRFNPKSILAQAQCKNMLFFGNIVKNSDNYKELKDCALRIIPLLTPSTINVPDNNYHCNDSLYGYYSSLNMYNKVGYFNNEYYRFGVVFIYLNGTLSNVYNTLGGILSNDEPLVDSNWNPDLFTNDGMFLTRNYIKINDEGWIEEDKDGKNLNSRGVCYINLNTLLEDEILGIKFNVPQKVLDFLKEDLGIRGMFFVRQKCIPNTLALCYILPMDEYLKAPVITYKDSDGNFKYVTECFVSLNKTQSEYGRFVVNDYESRLFDYKGDTNSKTEEIKKSITGTNAYAAICPDFLLNQPYYNQIFNGNKFSLAQVTDGATLTKNNRFYIEEKKLNLIKGTITNQVTICTVTDDVPSVALLDKVYKLRIGELEEAYKFEYAGIDNGSYNAGDADMDAIRKASNIVRGMYSPYLAIYSESKLKVGELYDIYRNSTFNSPQEFKNRMDSSEPFYAISNRYNFDGLAFDETNNYRTLVCWKGDCYINNFTYRLNRNFNDPSLPNNDKIIDKNTWRDHYNPEDSSDWTNISRSDLNAVQMGSWITIKVRSAMNYALRSEDNSYVSEKALMGSPRTYYPRNKLMWRGENKLPDSYLYNDAYRATLGFKCYFTNNDINYIKDTFSNRILYSAISILDSFKNNYRYSLSTYFRDYSQEYGSIQKLVGFEGYLLVVFEHAIAIAVVNERILAGEGDGEPVFINTKNVLPEELTIITDTYGTQWPESVIKSEAGYVYGVDTVAKKLWRVKGQEIEILSDFKVNKFLIDNISLGERERDPIVGLKNVKTHYNNNKKDIMFTFYDDVYQDEEKVWNLCYNELLGCFTTFYSWVPSYSENIDTQYFTFNRDVSKKLSLLKTSNYLIPDNYGVLLECPILTSDTFGEEDLLSSKLYYKSKSNRGIVTVMNPDGTTYNKETEYNGSSNDEYLNVDFKVEKDHWGNYKKVDILTITKNYKEEKYLTLKKSVSENFLDGYNGLKNSNNVLGESKLIIEDNELLLNNLNAYSILNDKVEEYNDIYVKNYNTALNGYKEKWEIYKLKKLEYENITITYSNVVEIYNNMVLPYRNIEEKYNNSITLYNSASSIYENKLEIYNNKLEIYNNKLEVYNNKLSLYNDAASNYNLKNIEYENTVTIYNQKDSAYNEALSNYNTKLSDYNYSVLLVNTLLSAYNNALSEYEDALENYNIKVVAYEEASEDEIELAEIEMNEAEEVLHIKENARDSILLSLNSAILVKNTKETEKNQAETVKNNALTEKQAAESSMNNAETLKNLAEQNMNSAETAKNQALSELNSAETDKNNAESEKNNAESVKKIAYSAMKMTEAEKNKEEAKTDTIAFYDTLDTATDRLNYDEERDEGIKTLNNTILPITEEYDKRFKLWEIVKASPYNKDLPDVFTHEQKVISYYGEASFKSIYPMPEFDDLEDLDEVDSISNISEYVNDSVYTPLNNAIDYGCFSANYYNWVFDEEKFKNVVDFEFSLLGGITLVYITPYSGSLMFSTELIAFTTKNFINNQGYTKIDKLTEPTSTDFYLHGNAGIFNVVENLYPTYWYGEYHPFEFEFIVNDKIGLLKIFTDLEIISNKAEPESFHFEIEGDNYEFSSDKRTMYFRQEATKNLYLNLGSDILFDRNYTDVIADKYTYELHYRDSNTGYTSLYRKLDRVYPIESHGLVRQVKSTIFPLYYERIDTYNDIYHHYREMLEGNSEYDFKNLSGSEIVWDRTLNQFNIVTHIKNSPIDLVGRLRGNSRYKEGKWYVLIPSIIFNLKNELDWIEYNTNTLERKFILGTSKLSLEKLGEYTIEGENLLDNIYNGMKIPPIVVNSSNTPNDLSSYTISADNLPNIYARIDRGVNNPIRRYISVGDWTYRKETKIRDKWMKVRVRYSGKNLAVIHSVLTLYNISYA